MLRRPAHRAVRAIVAALAALAAFAAIGIAVNRTTGGRGAGRWHGAPATPSRPGREPSTAPSQSRDAVTVTYQGSDTTITNPERGFAHLARCDDNDLSTATLRDFRAAERISLVWCMFYLQGYRTGDLDAAILARVARQFAAVRGAGLKMVVRFAYTENEAGDDAAPAVVLRHIAQLKPYLRDNADVILAVQAGFVGTWGEWYYTKHFGNEGAPSATDRANRRAVLDALLAAVPDTRMVQVRTPAVKRSLFGAQPLGTAQAHSVAAPARIGFHNDCFLATESDMGTYADAAVERPYLAEETAYVVMGGETCRPNPPRTQCATARSELAKYHWTYLNTDYHAEVLAGWRGGGCFAEIQRRLGYRLVLQDGVFPTRASRSGSLPLRLTLRNDGWAAPVNPRRAELVLRTSEGTVARRVPLAVDPRGWKAGAVATIETAVTLPADLPEGAYRLGLALTDPAPSLATRPEYAVQTANAGLWDAATGTNDLRHSLTVTG